MAFPRTPLKYVTTYNDEVLPESFDPDGLINYIEISDVDASVGITGSTTVRFSEAPSRARRVIRRDDVLISTVRTYLRAIASADRDHDGFIASTGFCILRPSKVHPGFLKFAASNPEFVEEVIARSTGISYPAINASDLVRLSIPAPSWTKQESITKFLDRETAQIDELIGKQERLIEMLAEKRQAIITHAVTKGLDPTTLTKHSGVPWLGEVPQDWVICRLKDLLAPSRGALRAGPFGSALTSEDMEGNFAKVFNQATVIRQDALHGDKAVDERKFAELVAFETFPGDLLVTTRGTIGRAFVLPQGAPRGILHPCLIRMQLSPARIDTSFLAMLMNETTLMRDQFYLASNATTIGVIYTATLANIVIALPPLQQQHEILLEIDIQASKLGLLQDKAVGMVRLLRERRSALISAAVTGEIDVREGAV